MNDDSQNITNFFVVIKIIIDPNPAFYLKDSDPDPESQTNVDPCGFGPWTCYLKKLDFDIKKYIS